MTNTPREPNTPDPSTPADHTRDADRHEWFDSNIDPEEGRAGLRFSCTMCGNCCTGPEGYVLVDDAEIAALAARLGMTEPEFRTHYTHMTIAGLSLTERLSTFGRDCVFLDREAVPGKAVCGVYEDRPRQCRTWPFWKSNLHSRRHWDRAKQVCPGMDRGTFVPVEEVRIRREEINI